MEQYKINLIKLKKSINNSFFCFTITYIYSLGFVIFLNFEITLFYILFGIFGVLQSKILFKSVTATSQLDNILDKQKIIIVNNESVYNFYQKFNVNIFNFIYLEKTMFILNFILAVFFYLFLIKAMIYIKNDNILTFLSFPALYLPSFFLFNKGVIEKST